MDPLKQSLGQFYSTKADVILKDFTPDSTIIEPFVGAGHLLKWGIKNGVKKYWAYDISPDSKLKYKCKVRDTLESPPRYKDKFVLTNPPYLAKNKASDKSYYDTYDDLYKLFLSQILGKVSGGIIIIPVNFLTSQYCELRHKLFTLYLIKQINIFENPIFSDTTYAVCSIWFVRKLDVVQSVLPDSQQVQHVRCYWHDSATYSILTFDALHDYLIGGEIYTLAGSTYVTRLTEKTPKHLHITNIKLYALDTRDTQIHLEYDTNHFIGKSTDRMFATIVIDKSLSTTDQKKVITKFNKLLNEYRAKYHSMFLSIYRDFGRRRIGFDLAYQLISYIIDNEL